ncbi:CBS domain-containing protein [Actinomadura verrucosospora]
MTLDLLTVSESESLLMAWELMYQAGVHHLPVADDEGGFDGIVEAQTRRPAGTPPAPSRPSRPSQRSCRSPPVTVPPTATIAEAARAMLADLGKRVTVVDDGEAFTAAGFDVQVFGTWHAVIHPDIPRVANIGSLINGALFHPGDALTVPDTAVDTLLLPVHGPWSTTGQLIDYVREVKPRQVIGVHDGAPNDIGGAMVAGLLGDNGPGSRSPCQRLTPSASAEIT